MTDKEQIEEIKQVIASAIKNYLEENDCSELHVKGRKDGTSTKLIAEALYNAGYRKVLLDTKYGKMPDCRNYAPWKLIKGHTEREVEKARKETAKEILQDLYYNLQTSQTTNPCKSNDYYNVDEWLKELAKEYGVEVE